MLQEGDTFFAELKEEETHYVLGNFYYWRRIILAFTNVKFIQNLMKQYLRNIRI